MSTKKVEATAASDCPLPMLDQIPDVWSWVDPAADKCWLSGPYNGYESQHMSVLWVSFRQQKVFKTIVQS